MRQNSKPRAKPKASTKVQPKNRVVKSTKASNPKVRKHRVMQNETLTHISRKYGLSVSALAQANNLNSISHITFGQELIIPSKSNVKAAKQKKQAQQNTYKVKPGDGFSIIAKRLNIDAVQLAKLNGMHGYEPLIIGQTLKLPTSAKSKKSSPYTKVNYKYSRNQYSNSNRYSNNSY